MCLSCDIFLHRQVLAFPFPFCVSLVTQSVLFHHLHYDYPPIFVSYCYMKEIKIVVLTPVYVMALV